MPGIGHVESALEGFVIFQIVLRLWVFIWNYAARNAGKIGHTGVAPSDGIAKLNLQQRFHMLKTLLIDQPFHAIPLALHCLHLLDALVILVHQLFPQSARSEERRVGKESGWQRARYRERK